MNIDVMLIQQSFISVLRQREKFSQIFYTRLFMRYPEVKHLFVGTEMAIQQAKLMSTLTLVVNHLKTPDMFMPVLQKLGEDHVSYRVKPEHYLMVGDILLQTLAECLGDQWTPAHRRAWSEAYAVIMDVMCRFAYCVQDAPVS